MVFMGEAGRRLNVQHELKKGQAYNSLDILYHSKRHAEDVMYRLRSNRQQTKEIQSALMFIDFLLKHRRIIRASGTYIKSLYPNKIKYSLLR